MAGAMRIFTLTSASEAACSGELPAAPPAVRCPLWRCPLWRCPQSPRCPQSALRTGELPASAGPSSAMRASSSCSIWAGGCISLSASQRLRAGRDVAARCRSEPAVQQGLGVSGLDAQGLFEPVIAASGM